MNIHQHIFNKIKQHDPSVSKVLQELELADSYDYAYLVEREDKSLAVFIRDSHSDVTFEVKASYLEGKIDHYEEWIAHTKELLEKLKKTY